MSGSARSRPRAARSPWRTTPICSGCSGKAVQPGTGASAGPALVGTLTFLDGTPLVGAGVQIQQRSVARRGEVVAEQTLAQVACDGEGRWSLPVALTPGARGGVSLRALYAGAIAGAGGPSGAGAAVSVPLALAASAISPAPAPAPTTPAAPAPAT